MIDIDSRVRESLVSQAAHAPDGAELLGAVHARSRRYTVRRRLVVGGLAAAVAVLVAVPLLDQSGGRRSTLQPAAPSNPVVLEKGPEPTLSFPLTPSWLPPGLTEPKLRIGPGTNGSVSYAAAGNDSLAISIDDHDWTTDPPVASDQVVPTIAPIQVGSKTGKLVSLGDPMTTDSLSVLFERKPGQWVNVSRSSYQLNGTDLARVGAGLTDKALIRTVPFTFTLLPRGYEATASNGESLTLAPKGVRPESAPARQFVASMQFISRGELGPGARITVGGRQAALLLLARGNYRLQVLLDRNQRIEIKAPTGALSREDFLRYAEGVAPKPGTRSQGG